MIVVSLMLNVLVLVAVGGSLVADATWTRVAYGDRTPARDILLAIYAAILVGSAGLLAGYLLLPSPLMVGAIVALLGLQIAYKLLTAATVRGALRNPVVLSNLGIAVVHATTLITVFIVR